MRLSIFVSLLVVYVSFSCKEEVFIPDPETPGLPRYSESGHNVAGALINNVIWGTDISCDNLLCSQVFLLQSDSLQHDLTVTFKGEIKERIYEGDALDLQFILDDFNLSQVADIAELNGLFIDLDGDQSYGRIIGKSGYFKGKCDRGTGYIHFKKVQLNSAEKLSYIVSGTFEIIIDNDCAESRILKGRFDHFVNRSNFDFW